MTRKRGPHGSATDLADSLASVVTTNLSSTPGSLASIVGPPASESSLPLDTYRLFFERTSDIVLIIGSDGSIIESNHAALGAYGYSQSAFARLNISDLREASTLESLPEQFEQALRDEVRFETVHRRRDGTSFAVEVHAASVVLEDERVIMSIIRDITERKKAENKLLDAERRAARDYLQLLSRTVPLAHAVGTANELISIYRELRDFVAAEMPCDGFFISLYDDEKDERTGAFVWSNEDGEIDVSTLPPIPLKGAKGPNARAVQEGRTIVVGDYDALLAKSRKTVVVGQSDDGLRPRSSVASPMFVMKRIIGTVEVQSYKPSAFSDDHVVALELAANLAAVAMNQFFAREALRESEEQLKIYNETLEQRVWQRTVELGSANKELVRENLERENLQRQRADLLSRLVTSQEDERRRIARDLHDHIGQQLTALELKVQLLLQKYADEPHLTDDLRETKEIMQRLNSDIDSLAWHLRPATLDDHGFVIALRNYIREWTARYQIDVEFWADEKLQDRLELPPDAETNLYRIVQEALNNVAKYAQATRVEILLDLDDERLRLIIEDNGVGFSVDKLSGGSRERRSLGIISMRERAALVGGTFAIESAPENGTSVFVTIPARHRSAAT